MNKINFLESTLEDGFEICRLANLKMFAAANTQRIASEWANELVVQYQKCDFNVLDDYARIINAFRSIKNTREDLGSFAIFLKHLENYPRVIKTKAIAQQSTFSNDQIADNRRKIADAFASVLNHVSPEKRKIV